MLEFGGKQGPNIFTVVENYVKVETRVNPDVFLLENYAALQDRCLVLSLTSLSQL